MLLEGIDDSVALLLAGWCVFVVLAVGRGIDRARETLNTRPAPITAPNRRSRTAAANPPPVRPEPQRPGPAAHTTPQHQAATQQHPPANETAQPPQAPVQAQLGTQAHLRGTQTTEHASEQRDENVALNSEGTEHTRDGVLETWPPQSSEHETVPQAEVQSEGDGNTSNFSTRYSFVPQPDGPSPARMHIQAGELPPQTQPHTQQPNTPQAATPQGYPSTAIRQIAFPGHLRVFSNWQILLFALVWTVFSGSAAMDTLMRAFSGKAGQRARLAEVAVPFLFFGGGAAVVYFLAMQGYNNYKMLVFGPSVQGRISRVEADPTLIINGMPSTRITYSFQPQGAPLPMEGYFRTFDRGLIQRFRESQPVTIMYEPGHPSRNISPDSLYIQMTELHRE